MQDWPKCPQLMKVIPTIIVCFGQPCLKTNLTNVGIDYRSQKVVLTCQPIIFTLCLMKRQSVKTGRVLLLLLPHDCSHSDDVYACYKLSRVYDICVVMCRSSNRTVTTCSVTWWVCSATWLKFSFSDATSWTRSLFPFSGQHAVVLATHHVWRYRHYLRHCCCCCELRAVCCQQHHLLNVDEACCHCNI